mmetsp:Transcript_41859/g.130294  ORF Transcript_41859/g.130294 Transcript_41859/m.130294 type:complete len:286 (+) Transcript_41859:109-966(+)
MASTTCSPAAGTRTRARMDPRSGSRRTRAAGSWAIPRSTAARRPTTPRASTRGCPLPWAGAPQGTATPRSPIPSWRTSAPPLLWWKERGWRRRTARTLGTPPAPASSARTRTGGSSGPTTASGSSATRRSTTTRRRTTRKPAKTGSCRRRAGWTPVPRTAATQSPHSRLSARRRRRRAQPLPPLRSEQPRGRRAWRHACTLARLRALSHELANTKCTSPPRVPRARASGEAGHLAHSFGASHGAADQHRFRSLLACRLARPPVRSLARAFACFLAFRVLSSVASC